jgi:S1-C subfamily serine protease
MEEGVDGVGVQSVSAGTSAARGGLKAGDRLVGWGGEDLIDVMDMVTRLREHKPGDVVTLVVVRDGAEVELEIVLLANDDVRQD